MRWMWIDRVLSLEPAKRLVAVKCVSLSEEHLHDHLAAEPGLPACPVMPASLIIEGCAQSAGILVGHAGGFKEKVLLAKVSSACLELDAHPGDTIVYDAAVETLSAQGASARVKVSLQRPDDPAARAPLGEVQLLFSHADQNISGIDFPEHNFVFGEAFQTLLRQSGFDA